MSCWGTDRQGDPRGVCLECLDPGSRFCLKDLGALGEGLTQLGLGVHALQKSCLEGLALKSFWVCSLGKPGGLIGSGVLMLGSKGRLRAGEPP